MSKSYVTLEQHICVVCAQPFDSGTLLLDQRLRPKFDMHTVTSAYYESDGSFADPQPKSRPDADRRGLELKVNMGMCPEHKKLKDEGYIALVGCDESKTPINGNMSDPRDAHRTGEVAHVRSSIWANLFNGDAPPKGVAFVGTDLMKMLASIQPAGGEDEAQTDATS